MSRIAARETTCPATTAPCSKRKPRKTQIDSARAQPMDASTNTNIDHSMTGRRPNRSDKGPITNCNTAEIARYPAIDRFTRP